jgi:ABC-type bacteriocin/lantibiotic exporter with double-glycine peptidase domain
MMLPYVELVLQQNPSDCGIAALAMLLGRKYGDVFAAAISASNPTPHLEGMSIFCIKRAAKKLGTTLRLTTHWDLETSCGILKMKYLKKRKGARYHVLLLKFGLLFDTDGTVWEPDVYFHTFHFTPVSIFTVQED